MMKSAAKFWILSLMAGATVTAASFCVGGMSAPKASSQTNQRPGSAISSAYVPDQEIRSLAGRIPADQVAYLRFDGLEFIEFGDGSESVTVRDRQLIRQFMMALRYAERDPTSPRLEMDTFEIHLKPRRGHHRREISLLFHPHDPKYCFGPEFWAALIALGLHQSAERREQVKRIAPQVRSIKLEVITSDTILVSKPEDVRQLLQELVESGTHFVDYSGDKPYPRLYLTLFTNNGGKLPLEYLFDGPLDAGAASPNSLRHYYSLLKPDVDPKTGQIRSKRHPP